MEVLLNLLLGLAFIIYGIIFVFYIYSGIGLMKITNKMGEKGSWMAWVPVLNLYLIGKLAFSKIVGCIIAILFVLGVKFSSTVNGETVESVTILPAPLNTIAAFALGILILASLYKIYVKFSKKAVILLILTILSFGFLAPKFLFDIRNNEIIDKTKDVC